MCTFPFTFKKKYAAFPVVSKQMHEIEYASTLKHDVEVCLTPYCVLFSYIYYYYYLFVLSPYCILFSYIY